MKEVKVLHILNELRLSGMEMMLLNSALEWSKNMVTVDIIANGNERGIGADKLIDSGYEVFHIPFYQNKLKAFLVFRAFLLRKRYDIIHINTEGNFLLHCLISGITGHQRIIRTFHSIFQPRPFGKIRRLVDRYFARFLNIKYISVGDSVAKNELVNFHTKSVIIYNWYNSERFNLSLKSNREKYISKYNIPADAFVLTTIGNCSPVKRHDLIIQALSQLPSWINWIYLHVGSEEKGFPERDLAASYNLSDYCHFLGPISEVEQILSISDVYLMSSQVEGLGIAALEAMGCGIPTILTKSPGLIDLIEKINGVIAVDASPKSIAEGVIQLALMSESQRKTLGVNLHHQIRNTFSMPEGVKNYCNFYQELMAE